MKAGDPALYELVEKFWPKYLTYNAYIDPSFEGTFKIVRDEATEYTYKSQYLINVTLTDDKDTNILGNDQDNTLTGNVGDNVITGGPGNDVLNGGEGNDTAVFSGNFSEYEITQEGNKTTVTDTVADRDGTDELTGIEALKFKDKTVK
jgi:Ca2+-binding RTX toxin-like protein